MTSTWRARLIWSLVVASAVAAIALAPRLSAQSPVTLTVHADRPGPTLNPMFYGMMTEEINFSYDGGLYAELIRNRSLKDNPDAPDHWSIVKDDGVEATIAVDTSNPVPNTALTSALKLTTTAGGPGQRAGVANEGYWGIPARPDTTYRASFYAKADGGARGTATVAIESEDGQSLARATVGPLTGEWKKYTATLKTGALTPSKTNRFVISTAGGPGTLWVTLVSLFPPTYHDRPNGMRPDIMELLAAMKPSFLRFPGGNYLEGPDFENRFNWKATIGPLEQRPTHMSPWRYRSSDGVGLLEFLEWCEDLHMEPLLAVYAGLHIDRGANILTGDALKPVIQDALDEIEYVTGGPDTEWGARRVKDGHPQPFPLRYVEIGNEDWLNNGKDSYNERFSRIADAIAAKYPSLKIISTMRSQDNYTHTHQPDLLDDHFYMNIPTALSQAHLYDGYSRSATKIFVGEWATNSPRTGDTPMVAFALADAAWLTGLERNADVVQMNSYAPVFVNVNPGARQWAVDLIGYDALTSFGSPSYYVQKMFSNNRGTVVLPATFNPLPRLALDAIPVAPAPPPRAGRAGRAGRGGRGRRGPQGPTGPFDGLYASATRDSATGDVILKLVNVQATAQPLRITVDGVPSIAKDATGEMLTGALDAVNTVDEPNKVVPVPVTIHDAGTSFTHELPAHSVTVLRLKTR
jgi:alpha-N-arabinofuranosidase